MLNVLKRVWVPLVVITAVVMGGLGVERLRGQFGSDEIFRWTGSGSKPIDSINTKHVTYEVFGSGAAVGAVSFLTADTEPVQANFAGLPWIYQMTTTQPAVVANVVAQGDGDQIGCRITINGTVKDEQFSNEHRAQVFCLVKAA